MNYFLAVNDRQLGTCLRINAKIRKQQIGRLFAAGVCACCGIGLLAS